MPQTQIERIMKSDAPIHKMSDGTLYKGWPNETWVRVKREELQQQKLKAA